jgi:hypothetical protein
MVFSPLNEEVTYHRVLGAICQDKSDEYDGNEEEFDESIGTD